MVFDSRYSFAKGGRDGNGWELGMWWRWWWCWVAVLKQIAHTTQKRYLCFMLLFICSFEWGGAPHVYLGRICEAVREWLSWLRRHHRDHLNSHQRHGWEEMGVWEREKNTQWSLWISVSLSSVFHSLDELGSKVIPLRNVYWLEKIMAFQKCQHSSVLDRRSLWKGLLP